MNNLRYVRVQDDLHGARAGDGGVFFPYQRQDDRNTMHFSVNSIVTDHTYGAFNVNKQGDLTGKILIITDPQGAPAPSGLNQVDTWFRMNLQNHPQSGQVQRGLALKSPTIIAPEGTPDVPGATMIHYDGTMQGRNAAFMDCMAEAGVRVEAAGFRNWDGQSWAESVAWEESTASRIYGDKAQYIHKGVHDNSLDDRLESMSAEGLLERMRHGDAAYEEDGVHTTCLSFIEGKAGRSNDALDRFFATAAPEDISRCGPIYEQLRQKVGSELAEARRIQAEIDAHKQSPEYLRPIMDAVVDEEMSRRFPAGGSFHVAKPGATSPLVLTLEQMALAIKEGHVNSQDSIWRPEYGGQWKPFPSVFKDSAQAAAEYPQLFAAPKPMAPPRPPTQAAPLKTIKLGGLARVVGVVREEDASRVRERVRES